LKRRIRRILDGATAYADCMGLSKPRSLSDLTAKR
jgi:hypothetical protein